MGERGIMQQGNELSPADVELPSAAWERQRDSIVRSLTRMTSVVEIETQNKYLVDVSAYLGSPNEWPEIAQMWCEFKSKISVGDELWEFNTVAVCGAFASGEEGYALIRQRRVVACFMTAITG